MIVYLTLAVCALLALLLIYRYDLYEKEPLYMVALVATVGAGAMWGVGHVEDYVLDLIGAPPRRGVVLAAIAASFEELTRLLIVIAIAWLIPKQFNDPMDGIIYGSVVGLGMAVTESVYYMSLTAWPPPPEGPFIPPTEIVRLCGHLVMGGITGFAVGMMRMEMKRWIAVLLGCVSISMTMHFLWDWIAFDAAMRGEMLSWQTISAAAMMLFGMVFYGVLVVIGSDWSRREFAPHSARSLWKWPFTLLVRRDFSEASRSTTHQDRDSTP